MRGSTDHNSALSTVIPHAQSVYTSCQVSGQMFRSIGFELALLLPRLQLLEELLRYEGINSNHKTQLSIVLNHFATSVRDLQKTKENFDDRLLNSPPEIQNMINAEILNLKDEFRQQGCQIQNLLTIVCVDCLPGGQTPPLSRLSYS